MARKSYTINGIKLKPGMTIIAFDNHTTINELNKTNELSYLYIVFPIKNNLGCVSYKGMYEWDVLSSFLNEKMIYKIYDVGNDENLLGKLLYQANK